MVTYACLIIFIQNHSLESESPWKTIFLCHNRGFSCWFCRRYMEYLRYWCPYIYIYIYIYIYLCCLVCLWSRCLRWIKFHRPFGHLWHVILAYENINSIKIPPLVLYACLLAYKLLWLSTEWKFLAKIINYILQNNFKNLSAYQILTGILVVTFAGHLFSFFKMLISWNC